MLEQYAAILILVIMALATVFLCMLASRRLRPSPPASNTPVPPAATPGWRRDVPFHRYGLAFVALMLQGAMALLLIWATEFRALLASGQDGTIGIVLFLLVICVGLSSVWRKGGFQTVQREALANQHGE
jgi:NADH:ubiquinone oxidoreductase subunit 3 (subunit A)